MSRYAFALLVQSLVCSSVIPVNGATETVAWDRSIGADVSRMLAGCQIAPMPPQTRGADLEGLYRASVSNVPVILSEKGLGSSAVIIVKPDRHALLITNYHVVRDRFTIKGQPSVIVVFYSPELKNQPFDGQRFGECLASSTDQSPWCQAVRRSTRVGTIVRYDQASDLALVSVANAPPGVTGFRAGNIQSLEPGASVAAIGHPTGLLWSFTTGIISAIRTNFSLGNGTGTLVQTQTPINPGNSGGPLIAMDGTIAGIIFGARAGERVRFGGEELTIPTEGLNYAIGIDTALTFTSALADQRPGR